MPNTLNKTLMFVSLIGQLIIVGLIDRFSGYELKLSPLYAVIVGFATWNFNLTVGLVTSCAAAVVTGLAEKSAGLVYTHEWVAYANACSRLVIFLFVTFSFSYFKKTLSIARQHVKAFDGPVPVCSCCNRVDGGDGFWMDFPTFLRRNSHARPEYKICPLCVDSKNQLLGNIK